MTVYEQKAYNAEHYPASVLTWLNEATDRAHNSQIKEIETPRKEASYWKLSFHKTLDIARLKETK